MEHSLLPLESAYFESGYRFRIVFIRPFFLGSVFTGLCDVSYFAGCYFSAINTL